MASSIETCPVTTSSWMPATRPRWPTLACPRLQPPIPPWLAVKWPSVQEHWSTCHQRPFVLSLATPTRSTLSPLEFSFSRLSPGITLLPLPPLLYKRIQNPLQKKAMFQFPRLTAESQTLTRSQSPIVSSQSSETASRTLAMRDQQLPRSATVWDNWRILQLTVAVVVQCSLK